MSQLNLHNFAARKIIQARWQRDPICQLPTVNSFDSCFTRIQQQPIITPVSLENDYRLTTIYTNYGIFE
jgi:hypothetical protein